MNYTDVNGTIFSHFTIFRKIYERFENFEHEGHYTSTSSTTYIFFRQIGQLSKSQFLGKNTQNYDQLSRVRIPLTTTNKEIRKTKTAACFLLPINCLLLSWVLVNWNRIPRYIIKTAEIGYYEPRIFQLMELLLKLWAVE